MLGTRNKCKLCCCRGSPRRMPFQRTSTRSPKGYLRKKKETSRAAQPFHLARAVYKRSRDDSKSRGDNQQKPKNNRFGEFMDSLKANAQIGQTKLFHEKGKCLFCGSNKHSAKACRVNMQTRFDKDAVRLKNNSLARDLASKFFVKDK